MFHIRPAIIPDDYAQLTTLINTVARQPVTPEQLQEDDELPPGSVVQWLIAVDDGQPRGNARAYRYPNTRAGKLYVAVAVDPLARQQGSGTALFAAIEGFAREQGATLLVGDVRDDDQASLNFVQRRGYTIRRHAYDSTLDLRTFDAARFAADVERTRQHGIRFLTLADEPGAATEHKLYELFRRTMPDIPGYEAQSFMAFDAWRKFAIEASGKQPDLMLIAANGDQFVGVTTMRFVREHIYTELTLVDSLYRGRGIALALKVLAAETAQRYNKPYMRTGNDSTNAPMLAVNRKLGYVPIGGDYEVLKQF